MSGYPEFQRSRQAERAGFADALGFSHPHPGGGLADEGAGRPSRGSSPALVVTPPPLLQGGRSVPTSPHKTLSETSFALSSCSTVPAPAPRTGGAGEACDQALAVLRARRHELAIDRWRQCDRRATLYDRFLRWRRTVRRAKAVRDVFLSALEKLSRCMLVQCFSSWRSRVHQRLRLELSTLLLYAARRGFVMRRWERGVRQERLVRQVRTRSLQPLFHDWARRCRALHRALRSATRMESSHDATLNQRILRTWRTILHAKESERALTRKVLRGWAGETSRAAGRNVLAERLHLMVFQQQQQDCFQSWWSYCNEWKVREQRCQDSHKRWKRSKFMDRWRQSIAVAAACRHLDMRAARHWASHCWAEWGGALRATRSEDAGMYKVARRHCLEERCRRSVRHWITYLRLCQKILLKVQVAEFHHAEPTWWAWQAAIRIRKFYEPLLLRSSAPLLQAWHLHVLRKHQRRRRTLEASVICRHGNIARALQTWQHITARRRRTRDLRALAVQHWSGDHTQRAVRIWSSATARRQRRAARARSARSQVVACRRRAAVCKWHSRSTKSRHEARLADAAKEFWVASARLRATRFWRCHTQRSCGRRRALGTACDRRAGVLAIRSFQTWLALHAWKRRKRFLSKQAELLLARSIFIRWHHRAVDETKARASSIRADSFHVRILLQLSFAGLVQYNTRRRRARRHLASAREHIVVSRLRLSMATLAERGSCRRSKVHKYGKAVDQIHIARCLRPLHTWAAWASVSRREKVRIRKVARRSRVALFTVVLSEWASLTRRSVHVRHTMETRIAASARTFVLHVLATWSKFVAKRSKFKKAADEVETQRCHVAKQSSLQMWHMQAARRLHERQVMTLAIDLWSTKLQHSCVKQWRLAAAMEQEKRDRLGIALVSALDRQTGSALQRWRAVSFWQRVWAEPCSHEMFTLWSECAVRQRLHRSFTSSIRMNWKKSARAASIHTWHSWASRERKLRKSSSEAADHRRSTARVSAFTSWLEIIRFTSWHREAQQTAETHHRQLTRTRGLQAWQGCKEQLKQGRTAARIAGERCDTGLLREVAQSWLALHRCRRQRSLTIHAALNLATMTEAGQMLRSWNECVARRRRLRSAAESFNGKREEVGAKRILQAWHSIVELFSSGVRSAEQRFFELNVCIMQHTIRTWLENMVSMQREKELTEKHANVTQEWVMRSWHLCAMRNNCSRRLNENLRRVWQTMARRKALRTWSDGAKIKNHVRWLRASSDRHTRLMRCRQGVRALAWNAQSHRDADQRVRQAVAARSALRTARAIRDWSVSAHRKRHMRHLMSSCISATCGCVLHEWHQHTVWATHQRAAEVAFRRGGTGVLLRTIQAWKRNTTRRRCKRIVLPQKLQSITKASGSWVLGLWRAIASAQRRIYLWTEEMLLRNKLFLCSRAVEALRQYFLRRKDQAKQLSEAKWFLGLLHRRQLWNLFLQKTRLRAAKRSRKAQQNFLAAATRFASTCSIAMHAWISFRCAQERIRRLQGLAAKRVRTLCWGRALEHWRCHVSKQSCAQAAVLQIARKSCAMILQQWLAHASRQREERFAVESALTRRSSRSLTETLSAWRGLCNKLRESYDSMEEMLLLSGERSEGKSFQAWYSYTHWRQRIRCVLGHASEQRNFSMVRSCFQTWAKFKEGEQQERSLDCTATEQRSRSLLYRMTRRWQHETRWQQRARIAVQEMSQQRYLYLFQQLLGWWLAFARRQRYVKRSLRSCRQVRALQTLHLCTVGRRRQRHALQHVLLQHQRLLLLAVLRQWCADVRCEQSGRRLACAVFAREAAHWHRTAWLSWLAVFRWCRQKRSAKISFLHQLQDSAKRRGFNSLLQDALSKRRDRRMCKQAQQVLAHRKVSGFVDFWHSLARRRRKIANAINRRVCLRDDAIIVKSLQAWVTSATAQVQRRTISRRILDLRRVHMRQEALATWHVQARRKTRGRQAVIIGFQSRCHTMVHAVFFSWHARVERWRYKQRVEQENVMRRKSTAWRRALGLWHQRAARQRFHCQALRVSRSKSSEKAVLKHFRALAAFHELRMRKRCMLEKAIAFKKGSLQKRCLNAWIQAIARERWEHEVVAHNQQRLQLRSVEAHLHGWTLFMSRQRHKRKQNWIAEGLRSATLLRRSICLWQLFMSIWYQIYLLFGSMRQRKEVMTLQCCIAAWFEHCKCRARTRNLGRIAAALRAGSSQLSSIRWWHNIAYRRRKLWQQSTLIVQRHCVQLGRVILQGWVCYVGWKRRKRHVLLKGTARRRASLQSFAWHTFRAGIAWQFGCREVVASALQRSDRRRACRGIRALEAFSTWRRVKRRAAERSAASDMLQVWTSFVAQKKSRRQNSRMMVLRWSRCWEISGRVRSLRTWRAYAAQHRWDRLVEQEVTWRQQQRAVERSWQLLLMWTGRRRRHKIGRLRASLHAKMVSSRSIFILWRWSVRLRARIRRSAGAVSVHRVARRRSQGFAALNYCVAQRRQQRARTLRALAWAQMQLLRAAYHSWRGLIQAQHLNKHRMLKASTYLLCSLGRAAVCEWRLCTRELQAVRRREEDARLAALRAWKTWIETLVRHRAQTNRARRRLHLFRAVRSWRAWRRERKHGGLMRLRACTLYNTTHLRAALLAWTLRHATDCLQRSWLAVSAAVRQWRRVVRLHQGLRYAMEWALDRAGKHNRKRLRKMILKWWAWLVAWTTANLEAAARLVRERHRAREFQQRLRRRTAGPNDEELLLMEAIFMHWHIHHNQQMHIVQRLKQEVASHNYALLLLALDEWVDFALPPHRSENLRRRRHVRFDLDQKNARKRHGIAAGQPSKTAGAVRSITAGSVGQWAHKTKAWEASAAFMDSVEPDSCELKRQPRGAGTLTRSPSPVLRVTDGTSSAADASAGELSGILGVADTGSTVSPAGATPRRHRQHSGNVAAMVDDAPVSSRGGSPAASPELFGKQRIVEEVVGLSSHSHGLYDGAYEAGQPQRYHMGQWPPGSVQAMARDDALQSTLQSMRQWRELSPGSRARAGTAAPVAAEGGAFGHQVRAGSGSRSSPFAATQGSARSGVSTTQGTPSRDGAGKKKNDILRFFKGTGRAGA